MDFNLPELLILVVLAVIIFGPEKLPEMARKSARLVSYLRGIANNARTQLREELGPEFADIKLSDLNPRALASRIMSAEDLSDLQSIQDELKGVAQTIQGVPVEAQAALDATYPNVPVPVVVRFDSEAT